MDVPVHKYWGTCPPYPRDRRLCHIGPYGERKHEPITGGWGLCPQRGSGKGVRGQIPLKLNTFLCCDMPEMAQSCYVYELLYGH